MPCKLRWTSGLKMDAEVIDITSVGCRVRYTGASPRCGYLLLSFGNYNSFDAEIVWAKDGEAGMAKEVAGVPLARGVPAADIAAAVLYLLLPYTATMTGRVDHALPGALMVWAVATYRRPFIAGALIGLAIGAIYDPVFLLPLWCSFYWERGARRFALGVTAALAVLVIGLWFTSPDAAVFVGQLRQMFGWILPNKVSLEGFWALPGYDAVFRLPVLAAFIALIATLAIWPAPNSGWPASTTASYWCRPRAGGPRCWRARAR
jgi:hypothetical protein